MGVVTETGIINSIASYERAIVGVKNSYDAYANPDSLPNGSLPAVMHYPEIFNSTQVGHHGIYRNELFIVSLLFVSPRQLMGGKLKFLENEAMPFLAKWREQFQTSSVIRAILSSNPAVQKFELVEGRYVAGGLLTFNDTEYIGAILRYRVVESA